MQTELTHAELKKCLGYNPETGIFTWRVTNSSRALVGATAGCLAKKGQWVIRLHKRNYFAHRLAWFYVFGIWPKNQIDHWDGHKANNKIKNLREATNSQNQMNVGLKSNNTTGYKGIRWNKVQQKWNASYKLCGQRHHIGSFICAEAAHAAYTSVTEKVFGDFYRQ